MIKQKRGLTWTWILVALILIGLGVVLYFLLTSDGSIGGLGNSIPQPPALPE